LRPFFDAARFKVPPQARIVQNPKMESKVVSATRISSLLTCGEPMSESSYSRRFDPAIMTSGPPPETDIVRAGQHVSNVPGRDIALVRHA
jgi:hypothetical protein